MHELVNVYNDGTKSSFVTVLLENIHSPFLKE